MSRTTSQRGQALVMTLLFGAVAGLAVLLMFNSSLLANTKSQLQNAADAGAYSAAVLQARDHNFSAYTNRAMIANQVAVAQFVSLDSYFQDAKATHERANSLLDDTVYKFFPSSTPLWDAAIKIPVDSVQSAVADLAKVAVRSLDLLILALENAQQVHHVGTATEMFLVADEVVKKNDPGAAVTKSAFMLGEATIRLTKWDGHTAQHNANDTSEAADRFADAVVSDQSTDWFIRNRASVPAAAWGSSVWFCFGADVSFSTWSFPHFGGTLLSEDKRRWLALDASMGVGGWVCHWECPFFDACAIGDPFADISTSAPFLGGNGGSEAGDGSSYGGLGNYKGYKSNPFLSWMFGDALVSPAVVPASARFWVQGPGTSLDDKGGIQDHYRDVKDFKTLPKDQTPEQNGGAFPVVLEVERSASSVHTSSQLLPGANRLKLDAQTKGDTMRTIASAQSFFYRPKDDDSKQFTRNGWHRSDDGKTEYENLFSPYWQARLAPNGVADEAASLAGQ